MQCLSTCKINFNQYLAYCLATGKRYRPQSRPLWCIPHNFTQTQPQSKRKCKCKRTRTRTHAHTCTYIHAYMYMDIHACIHTYIHAYMNTCNTLTRICGVLSRLKHYVPVLILKKIYNSLFLSHLNYGITAWGFNVGPRIKTL